MPLHKQHEAMIRQAATYCDNLTIILGSANRGRSIKYPFTLAEREDYIRKCLPDVNLKFSYIFDYYDDMKWLNALTYIVGGEGTLLNFNKADGSSDWIDSCFCKTFSLNGTFESTPYSATTIREALYKEEDHDIWKDNVSPPMYRWLIQDNYHIINDMVKEYNFCENYKKDHKGPYGDINHVASDVLMIVKDSIVLIERKSDVGVGQLALPGGFLNSSDESWLEGAKREVEEETNIDLSNHSSIKNEIFDQLSRSSRGRIITRCYMFNLEEEDVADMKAKDDAKDVRLVPFKDITENLALFADHSLIIHKMLT